MAMTQREKDALDKHITREGWEEPWNAVDSEGNPTEGTIFVTKTVATIVRSDQGMHPVEAAFVAIAQDDSEGRYEFSYKPSGDPEVTQPMRWTVTVERN